MLRKKILLGVLAVFMLVTVGSASVRAYSAVDGDGDLSVSGKSYTPQYEGMFMYAVDEDEGSAFISGIEYDGETEIVIPDNLGGYPVTALYNGSDPYSGKEFNLFADMANLKYVSIPDSVSYIDTGAFRGCTSLESINLPSSLVYILDETFDGCTSLKEVGIPSTIKVIADGAFSNCPNLKTIKTSSISTGISSYVNRNSDQGITVLYENDNNSDTDIISSDTDLEEKPNVPYYWGIYTYLVKDGKVIIIDVNITSEEDIVIPSKINGKPVTALNRGIGEKEMHLFEGSSIKSIVIPDSVSYIAEKAFEGCKQLSSVSIPSTVTKIFERTFANCKSLKSISLSDSIVYLDDTAFDGCGSDFVINHSGKSQGINSYLFRHRSQDGNKKSNTDTVVDTDTEGVKDSDVGTSDVDTSDVDTSVDVDTSTDITDGDIVDTDSVTDTDFDGSDSDSATDTDSKMYMFGDIDGDGNVTSSDALLVLRSSIGLMKLDPMLIKYADVDCDDNVSSADALAILRYSVKLGTNTLIGSYDK